MRRKVLTYLEEKKSAMAGDCTYIDTHTHTHIYIYIERERERDMVDWA